MIVDVDALVAEARGSGRADLGGLRLDIPPDATDLLICCSGLNPPGHAAYAHDFTRLDHTVMRLFASDASNRWFLAGIGDLTASIHDTIALLGRIVAAVAPQHSVALGTSMGGYLSLLLARAGIAEQAIAFSPQTALAADWRAAHEDRRWHDLIDAGLAALHPVAPPDPAEDGWYGYAAAPTLPDWSAPVAGAGRDAAEAWNSRRPSLHLFYPTGDADDCAHARRMQSVPGVRLYPVATFNHVLSRFLRDKGVLHTVIDAILAGRDAGPLVAPLRDDDDDPERAYRDGIALLAQGASSAAEREFRIAVAACQPLGHYFDGLAESLWRQGRHEEALRVAQDAAARFAEDPHRHLSLAGTLERAGLIGDAQARLRHAVALAPGAQPFADALAGFIGRWPAAQP